MKGALPPSSIETFLTVEAHWRIRVLPTSVDPVNENLRTSGLSVNSSPTLRESVVVRTLNTPAGTPASSASTASASADRGVSEAGLMTTGQPAASAGPALRVIIALGKFHGVTMPTTPTLCLMVRMRRSGRWVGITSP
jgi:hypothetical protein